MDNTTHHPAPAAGRVDAGNYVRRVLIALAIAAVLVVVLLSSWYLANVILLTFAGILLGTVLRGAGLWLAHRTPLSTRWATSLCVVALLVLLVGGGWWLGPNIVDAADRFAARIPQSLNQLEEALGQSDDAAEQAIMRFFESVRSSMSTAGALNRAFGIFSTVLGVIAGILVILFTGMYFAVGPGPYIDGALTLAPPYKRERLRAVLREIGHSLRWWLIGRLVSMAVVAVLTYLGLLLLGMESAVTLAVLAGLLSFIPNIGPVLSAVPAVLIALPEGPMMALYVVLLYIAVQTVESFLITPLVEQRVVTLPPALILITQIALGVTFGFLGVLLATPLTLVGIISVQMLYIQDVLRDPVEVI